MKVGSLFSGIGGIELGFHWAGGFETLWFVENELYAQEILKKRYPKALIYGDIKEIDFRTVPKIDILTGGFPCQDISNAGKRAGIKGHRSGLWSYYLEAIRILRPRIAVIENVSALLNRGLNVILRDIATIRYDAEWHCISASSIGALHQRDRIFIFAYAANTHNRFRQMEQIQTGRNTLEKGFNDLAKVSHTYEQGLERENKMGHSLPDKIKQLHKFPTPIRGDWKGQVRKDGSSGMLSGHQITGGGQLNPNWVEWLMGFPIGWTELNVLETQSFLKLRKSLRKRLKKC